MINFEICCCQLFAQHMPCDYRVSIDEHTQKLSVLVIGYGPRLDTILQKVLTTGQLPDTLLEVAIATSNPLRSAQALFSRAPALAQFADVFCENQQLSSAPDHSLCILRFESTKFSEQELREYLKKHSQYQYILVSTGKDELNRKIAQICASVSAKEQRLIAFVQKGKPAEPACCPDAQTKLCCFGFDNPQDYRLRIEQIALNLHYAYAKAQDSRRSMTKIIEEFHDPYNYLSNLDAAVHICNKLGCYGIKQDFGKEASVQFAKYIRQVPETLDKLAAVEHRRWMMEKLLQGYQPQDELSLIYSNGATTHSRTQKWHCCLVPCDPAGLSRLEKADWINCSTASPRTDLDELDRMSLNIHNQCSERAAANRRQIQNILLSLRDTLTGHLYFSDKTRNIEKNLESAIAHMWQKKSSSLILYEKFFSDLKEMIGKEGKLLQAVLTQQLELLEQALLPLKEYLSYKDYKSQDRLLVEQIPFALTHLCSPVLVKLTAEKIQDDVFSIWQMEPRKSVFWATADSLVQLWKLRERFDSITCFLQSVDIATEQDWYILVPQGLIELASQEPDLFSNWHCTLSSISEHSQKAFQPIIEDWIQEISPNYFDITGGEPLLAYTVELSSAAQNCGTFYIQNGCFHNLHHAEELEFPMPHKNLTVREMISACGASLEKIESNERSDLSAHYKLLWEIAQNTTYWNEITMALSRAHSWTRRPYYRFDMNISAETSSLKQKQLHTSHASAMGLLPVLQELEKRKLIQNISITEETGEQTTLTYSSADAKFPDYLEKLAERYQSSDYFEFKQNSKDHQLYVNLRDLWVRDYNFREDQNLIPQAKEEMPRFLLQMSQAGLIHNYKSTEMGISYRYQSRDIVNCLHKAGNILENYIYYSALLNGNFDDVEMGVSFMHNPYQNSASNEIDIICTKGTSSLFISAKFVRSLQEKLNYILYEITLLAEHFGINAKPILVAPCFDQFTTDPETGDKTYSQPVTHALRRGVYLIGKECMQDDVFCKVLENILTGQNDWCGFVKDYI